MRATITDTVSGFEADATVASVASTQTVPSGGTAAPYVAVTLDPASPVPIAEVGADLQVTVSEASTAGPVLSVPVAAIFTAGSGETVVDVVGAGGARTQVPVRTGLSGAGMGEVIPSDPAQLAAGDEVVTGTASDQGSGSTAPLVPSSPTGVG